MSVTASSPPQVRPQNPCFSSGPCAKRPGWTPAAIAGAEVGRSHRAKPAKAKLKEVIDRTKATLGLPDDHRVGIMPASDTGAVEAAMWSMLGARGTDVVAWESFGQDWVTDAEKQLKLSDLRSFTADYGKLPDLSQVDAKTRDVVFNANGTTSGVKLPSLDWIPAGREGVTICDATSGIFAMDLDWSKLDVVTWSWQKVLGSEAAHGMLHLSPRAVERLESFKPDRPLPKIFRMTKNGKLNEGIFEGATINTPSMLAVEDALDSLRWAESVGGLQGLMQRSQQNFEVIAQWVERTPWIDFLAENPETRSTTSICLTFVEPEVKALDEESRTKLMKDLVGRLDKEGVAYDLAAYRNAPAGLRIWGGATVESTDIEALLPWIEWAYAQAKDAVLAG